MISVRKRLRALSQKPVHPLIIAISPVISLLAFNIQEVYPEQAIRSLLVSLLLGAMIWIIFLLILRNLSSAAALASITLLLFYSYGHIYNWIEDFTVGPVVIGRHRYLLVLWGFLFLATGFRLHRNIPGPQFTRFMNLAGMVLLLMPAVSFARFYLRPRTTPNPTRIPSVRLNVPQNQPLPDIYYIILDGYARSDYMVEAVGYDNSGFIDFLSDAGFYVAAKSRSNHNMTALSLAASLNMTPAQYLGVRMVRGDYPEPFAEPIVHSVVRDALSAIGYETVNFRSGYRLTEFQDADIYLSPDDRRVRIGARPNAFEEILLHTTLLQPFLESGLLDLASKTSIIGGAGTTQREIILYEYENLGSLPSTDGPKFIFAHIVAMHAPYIFDREGHPVHSDEAFSLLDDGTANPSGAELYRDQAEFITMKTMDMIESILDSYDTSPVIILQADHGSGAVEGMTQRISILNAILVEESCRKDLYPTLTPVNTFRVIFNCYFDAGLPLTSDTVYYSPWPRYSDYKFTPIENESTP
jgi:hypothetical protein